MTVVGCRKEAAARSESGNAKHRKRLEQDVSVGPADIGSRRTALAAENSVSDGQDGHALRRRRCSCTGLGRIFQIRHFKSHDERLMGSSLARVVADQEPSKGLKD